MVKKEETAEQPKKEVKRVRKPKAKKELTPEESVVILACINDDFLSKLNKLAEKEGVKLVLTNEQVIHDYVDSKSEIDETARMTAFLKDERNRKLAEEHAREIWRIVTGGKRIELSADSAIDLKTIVKSTTLSWKKADEMMNTLEVFGFVERIGKNIFRFTFKTDDICEHIKRQTAISVESLNLDIQRFKGVIESSSDIKNEDKEKYLNDFKSEVQKNIVF